MRVISNARLVEFAESHSDAKDALQAWRKLIEANRYSSFSDLRNTFGSVDIVGDRYVFDIRGNNYRVICVITFKDQTCYIKHVLTHSEYDKGKWK